MLIKQIKQIISSSVIKSYISNYFKRLTNHIHKIIQQMASLFTKRASFFHVCHIIVLIQSYNVHSDYDLNKSFLIQLIQLELYAHIQLSRSKANIQCFHYYKLSYKAQITVSLLTSTARFCMTPSRVFGTVTSCISFECIIVSTIVLDQ